MHSDFWFWWKFARYFESFLSLLSSLSTIMPSLSHSISLSSHKHSETCAASSIAAIWSIEINFNHNSALTQIDSNKCELLKVHRFLRSLIFQRIQSELSRKCSQIPRKSKTITMNILVIGSGGREHAICWKLQQSLKVSHVYVLPGSDAIAELPKTSCVKDVNLKNFKVSKRNFPQNNKK